MPLKLLSVVCVCAIAAAYAFAASAVAGISQTNPARAATKYLAPSTVSPACRSDARRRSACRVIREFFRAVNAREFASACTLLGERLRSETYGMPCERFLALAVPEPMRWGILGARRASSGVSVLVALGQSELDHIRMRRHLAYVDYEGGALRILDTRLVA
jgi:hypothetical protein